MHNGQRMNLGEIGFDFGSCQLQFTPNISTRTTGAAAVAAAAAWMIDHRASLLDDLEAMHEPRNMRVGAEAITAIRVARASMQTVSSNRVCEG